MFFLLPALLFGSLFVFLIPPFQSPDEPNHFFRAWQLSEGHFFPEKTEDRRLGGRVPESLVALSGRFAYLKNDYSARVSPDSFYRHTTPPLNAEKAVFHDFANTAIYAPTAYLPQATAIRLMRAFDAPPLYILYAVRWANLLVWSLLVWAALVRIPFLRGSLAALALLPASLALAASANADVLTNGLVFWLMAVFCGAAEKGAVFPPKISGFLKPGNFGPTLLAGAIVCANKLIVWPLLLLVGLYSDRKRARPIALLCTGLSAAVLWGYFADALFIPYDAYHPDHRDTQTLNEGVDPTRQLAFIAAHPFEFFKIAGFSLLKALPSSAAHFVGKFGWEKNYLPGGWLAALWFALLFLMAGERNPLSGRQRALTASAVLLFTALFCVTMYLLWHPVGAPEMGNFQGRYFVPAAPAAILTAAGLCRRAPFGTARILREIAFSLILLGNIAMIFGILGRYWM
jgi:uncharacterized membrane protein